MNTIDRFCDEYKKELTSLVQKELDNVTNIGVIPEKLIKYDIALDTPFDRELIKNVDIWIDCTGGTNLKYLSDVLKITYNLMTKNGHSADNFGISSQHEGLLVEFINIKPSHIEDDSLENILQKVIKETEYDGIIYFSKE